MGDLREVSEAASTLCRGQGWATAEKATRNIISQVQPTAVSEDRRIKVIDYVQRLIRACLGCEVLPYGSVPLKTYLPDGDIDLTAFGGAIVEDALVNDMVSILEGEDQNSAAEFVVKDVQLINAEVKLVKCIVQNIAVDISFNQIGGLCTLCFLEQADRFIGKDHLFKRSIILIKAWCYYESRILGAHHGLISTYALETLVLHIFHVFHSVLDGPLAVLYKFLDYFSKFDWENYCVSLTGRVRISSLPEIVVEAPENGEGDILLSNDFLRYCVDLFSVPSKGIDINSRTFPQKHLNIIDPLKENNNLGRSVSKGNFYRIRSAFTYGARKLGRILMQAEDKITDELSIFFSNTLDRHGGGQRPDVHNPVPMSSCNGFASSFSTEESESSCQEEKVISESKSPNCIGTTGDCKHNSDELSQDTMSLDDSAKGRSLLGYRFCGDANDLATLRIQGLKISDDSPKVTPPSGEENVSPLGRVYHAPHLYFSNSALANGVVEYGNSDTKQSKNNQNKVDKGDVLTTGGSADVTLAPNSVTLREDSNPMTFDWAPTSSAGNIESMNSLSDLSGDYDCHFNWLQYGRSCYEHASSVPTLPMPSPSQLPPSHFHSMNSWNAVHRSQFKRNGFSNNVIPSPVFYPMDPLVIPGMPFGWEEMAKPRGTGTYFPNTFLQNRPHQGYRSLSVKGRNQAPARSPRNNVRAMTFTEFPVDHSDIHQSYSPRRKVQSTVHGLTLQNEGSVGHKPLPESTLQEKPVSSIPQTPTQGLLSPRVQSPKPVPSIDQDRLMRKSSYHLKDEEDFPPLSV